MPKRPELKPEIVVGAGYLAGAIPFANLIARATKGVDLREVGTGTVSGTGLFYETGLKPLLAAGILDVAKGTVGPLLAGKDRPALAAAAGGAAVVGHNWSLFLRGAGGRGISPAMGAMLVNGWQGSLVLLAGIAGGRAVRLTSVGAFLAYLGLVPALKATRGRDGAIAAAAVVAPMLLKRLAGNRPPPDSRRSETLLLRLIFDQDTLPSIHWNRRRPGNDR
ncbi:MAG TPA: glycerol-3-phosphate acyltransferase [Acidimicrobiia bacterium]|nr:glycerol-3-phosphate acyltransferase [Acidimicrobiia bacterium]